LFSFPTIVDAQILKAVVLDENNQPLAFANAYELESGYGTTANDKGEISLKIQDSSKRLWISYVGYQKKSLSWKNWIFQ
jgi:hypothetical protein